MFSELKTSTADYGGFVCTLLFVFVYVLPQPLLGVWPAGRKRGNYAVIVVMCHSFLELAFFVATLHASLRDWKGKKRLYVPFFLSSITSHSPLSPLFRITISGMWIF